MTAPSDSRSPVVLVTGAARRVGAEIARGLHAAGARVAIHCRASRAEAEDLAAGLNGIRADSAAVFAADLLDVAALAPLVESVVTRFGRLDALINNASSFYATKVGAVDTAIWDDLIGTNLKTPLFPVPGRRAAPAEDRGLHREHRGHPRRAADEELCGVQRREGRIDGADAFAGSRTGAGGAGQWSLARCDPLAGRRDLVGRTCSPPHREHHLAQACRRTGRHRQARCDS
jgi:NAD(P)-dependent dehydrogenase (short-subunit alcohol dehydrogenase family)